MESALNIEPKFEALEFDRRYYTDTAKSAIESIAHLAEEAASNEDEAITRRAERDDSSDKGFIQFSYDPETRILFVTGDGDGMTAETMRKRLKRLGGKPEEGSRRGYFHRGIREVFLALGGGEVTSIGRADDGREVISRAVFDPEKGMAITIENAEPSALQREELGLEATGTRIAVPMDRWASRKPAWFTFTSLESQINNCVGLRPVLSDTDRDVTLVYGQEPPKPLEFAYPEGETLVAEVEVEIDGHKGTFWAKAAADPIAGGGRSKRTRRSGILVRGERAAYEVSVGDKLKSHPGMTRVFGELRLDGIEGLQRKADDEAQLVYKTDRSGLNPEHPVVEAIVDYLDEKLDSLVAGLEGREKKKSSPDMRRELQKLARVINEALKEPVGDLEDPYGVPKGDAEKNKEDQEPPIPPEEHIREAPDGIAFARDRIFLQAGGTRTMKIWFNSKMISEGTSIELVSAPDEIIHIEALSKSEVQPAAGDGISEVELTLKGGNTEGRHEVQVNAGGYSATLPVHVRFPKASGFITNIVTSDSDWESGSALYDESSGVVTVYVGRPEFRDAEARAKRENANEPWKHPLFRQLMVESVREAALWPAARRRAEVEWDELPPEERQDTNSFYNLVQTEFYELDYKLRGSLLKAFVEG